MDSEAARQGLDFLVRGVREGWIPRASLTYKEEESREAFEQGRLLFLRNWPYVYDSAAAPGSKVAGRFGVVPLPGSSVLGGSNLAINSHCRHPRTAADLLAYLMSDTGAAPGADPRSRCRRFAPTLYTDPALVRDQFPYLPILRKSIMIRRAAAQERPRYDQVSLAVGRVTSDAMTGRIRPRRASPRLRRDLREIVAGD